MLMKFQRRYLNTEDIIAIASDCARDDKKLQRFKRINAAQLPSHITFDAETGEYLINIPSEIRDEFPCLYFSTAEHVLEIHHIDPSPKFSFTQFPTALDASRKSIEAKIISALIASRQTMRWFEKVQWEDLTEEQKNMCYPVFVEDNIKYFPM